MNKKIIIAALILMSSFLGAHSVYAATTNCPAGQICYTPLEPIEGFTSGTANVDLPTFLQGLFRILFSLGALLAVGMLVVGGIEYMVSEVAHVKQQGLKRAQAAFYGLAILAGSYLILNTINPELLKLDFAVKSSQTAPRTTSNSVGDSNSSTFYTDCNMTSGGGRNADGSINLGGGANRTFSAESACAKALKISGGSFQNNARGEAILLINTTRLSISSFKAYIEDFSKGCEAAPGRVSSTGNPLAKNLTAYFCIKK